MEPSIFFVPTLILAALAALAAFVIIPKYLWYFYTENTPIFDLTGPFLIFSIAILLALFSGVALPNFEKTEQVKAEAVKTKTEILIVYKNMHVVYEDAYFVNSDSIQVFHTKKYNILRLKLTEYIYARATRD